MSESSNPFSLRLSRMLRMGQSDDPLSSLKAVTRWTGNLAVGDPLKAQSEILAEIKRYNDDGQTLHKDSALVLMALDEKAQDLQAALSRQYLRNPRMSRVVESELWHAIYQLNWEVLRGYHKLIFNYFRNENSSKLKAMIPLVTIRALRCFRQVIKWRNIRYMHPGDKTWVRLHQLYQIAENQQFSKTRLLAYPNDERESSCESEYLHVLMLDQSNSGSLFPRQIDLIDQWLGNWLDRMKLEPGLDPEYHTLAVDMTRDRGPRRVRTGGPELSTRYWSTLDLINRIRAIQNEIHSGTAPARLGLTENVRVAESLELLDHLVRQWGPATSREQRRRPRTAVKRMVEIVHDFPAIVAHVNATSNHAPTAGASGSQAGAAGTQPAGTAQAPGSMPAPPPLLATMRDIERWVMENESDCGFGTTIQARDKDWLRVGVLTALRTGSDPGWSLGVIRRLSRLGETESSVGIETLHGIPMNVDLHRRQTNADYLVGGVEPSLNPADSFPGLILNEGHAPEILLNPLHFKRNGVYDYSGPDGPKAIRLGDPIEQGEGWMRCPISWL